MSLALVVGMVVGVVGFRERCVMVFVYGSECGLDGEVDEMCMCQRCGV